MSPTHDLINNRKYKIFMHNEAYMSTHHFHKSIKSSKVSQLNYNFTLVVISNK